jgi:hypothetical protein
LVSKFSIEFRIPDDFLIVIEDFMGLNQSITKKQLHAMHSSMVVDVTIEIVTTVEQLDHFISVLVRITDLIINDATIFQQNLIVKMPILKSHHG